MRLALHENLLAWGVAFFATPLSSPSVILDVLNPKMFVKTCVFRHSFSCHFFFCVVFKEHFASAFPRIASPFLEKFVRVDVLRVPRFSSSRLALRKKSFAKTFASIFSVWFRCCLKTLVRVDDYAFLAFPSLRLAIRKISSQKLLLRLSLRQNKMVGLGRLELLTSRLSGVRSNQLSYRPM